MKSGFGAAEAVSARSAVGLFTRVTNDALLLAGLSSVSLAVTETEFKIEPRSAAVGVAVRVTVAVPFVARLPRLKTRLPPLVTKGTEALKLVKPAGSTSVRLTPVAGE